MIRHHGQPAGSLGARIDPWHGNAELGYWVAADYQGKGLVHRSASALIDYLVDVRGLERVEIRTVHANARSRAVAERLGFALGCQLTEAMSSNGHRQDVVLYGLNATR